MARADSQFKPGNKANPGGRPKGLAAYARSLVGDDGKLLADFWKTVMEDTTASMTWRLQASEFLANRAFGKAPQTVEVTGEEGGPVVHEHQHRLTLADVGQFATTLGLNGSS